MAESKEELKNLLMKLKKESEKAGLKLKIQKAKIMASGPIPSWQIDRENVETVSYFISIAFVEEPLKEWCGENKSGQQAYFECFNI